MSSTKRSGDMSGNGFANSEAISLADGQVKVKDRLSLDDFLLAVPTMIEAAWDGVQRASQAKFSIVLPGAAIAAQICGM